VRFDETESAVTRRVFRCDGHAYEHMIEYDLAEAFDRLAYERKLDTFIEGFGKARDSADGRVCTPIATAGTVCSDGVTCCLCAMLRRCRGSSVGSTLL